MSNVPPVPAANQSPFPLQEKPHAATAAPKTERRGTTGDTVAPLAERASNFARQRPWATAALIGTVALAVFNSLRGRRG